MADELEGNLSVAKLDPAGGSSYVDIANQLDATLGLSIDIIESTNKSSSQWKTRLYGNRELNLSFNGHLNQSPALDLDGSTEYAWVADNADFDLAADVTIEAQIQPDVVTGTQIICHKHDGTDGYILRLNADEIEFVIDNSGSTNSTTATTATNLTALTQYKIKVIYDGGTTTTKIYVDDVAQAQSVTGTVPATCGVNATRVTIGTDATASGSFFDGKLRKVAIANSGTDDTSILLAADAVGLWSFRGNLNDSATGGSNNPHNLTGVNIDATDYGDLTILTLRDAIKDMDALTIQFLESGTARTYTFSSVIPDGTFNYPQNDVQGYSFSALATGAVTVA